VILHLRTYQLRSADILRPKAHHRNSFWIALYERLIHWYYVVFDNAISRFKIHLLALMIRLHYLDLRVPSTLLGDAKVVSISVNPYSY
jgi:hypothetical protein